MSSITGLGLRNKVGLGKSNDSSSKPKQKGSSITGLGLRNKAAILTGNKNDPEQASRDHVITPRSALKDPSSFAPPPKNVNYYGGAAAERQVDKVSRNGPLSPAEYRAREEERANQEKEEAAREKSQRRTGRDAEFGLTSDQQRNDDAPGHRVPYRSDSTGLSTAQFAPPIARGAAADGTIVIRPTAPSKLKPKPPLPPRLPNRQNSNPETGAPFPSPTYGSAVAKSPLYRGQLNQERLNTPGAASVSVPGPWLGSQEDPPAEFGGRPRLPPRTSTGSSSNGPVTASGHPQISELQSRFARMRSSSPKAEAPTHGTMWAEQAAQSTSSFVRDDPTTNPDFNARIASKSNIYRERNGEQVVLGRKAADTLNQKYGLSDNASSYSGSVRNNLPQSEELGRPIELRDNTTLLVKKAPPPKPKKRTELLGISSMDGDSYGPPLSRNSR